MYRTKGCDEMVRYIKHAIKKILSLFANYIVHFIPKSTKEALSVADAEAILESYSPDPKTSALWDNSETTGDLDLTIIIPVYNVEKYLSKCMESVLHQNTKYSYEVIVVNDCSPDNSLCILDKYKKFPQVKILNHSTNRGISAARNTAVKEMRGKYVMFLDSDDFLSENAVESLMGAAYHIGADVVQGGYYKVEAITEKLLKSVDYRDCESVPQNGVIAGMPWGKVYKAQLFCRVCFPEGYWFEDTIVSTLITHLAKSIATISSIVYYYRQNPAGATSSSKKRPKSVDTFWVHRCTLGARKKVGLDTDEGFYEYLLRATTLSYRRTEALPETVKISMFVLFREMLQTSRKSHFIVSKKYRNLEKAILDGDFKRYSFLCKAL